MHTKLVAVVGCNGIPAHYGGFETLAEQLVRYAYETKQAISWDVFCSQGDREKASHLSANLTHLRIPANGAFSVFYDGLSLFIAGRKKVDTVLVLGVSGAIFFPFFKFFSTAKLVVNVDGIEWRRQKWSYVASRFLRFSERFAVRFADVVIADNQGVSDYLSDTYEVESVVIPYGGDHTLVDADLSSVDPSISDVRYLCICRVEPENNIEMILQAFSSAKNEQLVLIGNWDDSNYGKRLRSTYSEYENLVLLDPIYDQRVLSSYRQQCSGYVHGHSAGGTNPSLVEAMFSFQRILCFDCNFNRYTTEDKALYFSSAAELERLLEYTDTRDMLSVNLNEMACRRYNWALVANAYFEIL